MAEELGERTELPTGRRLSEARQRGQVAKSQDLTSAIDLLGGVLLIALFGGAALAGLAVLLRRVLEGEAPGDPLRVESLDGLILWAALETAKLIGPGLLAMLGVALLGNFVQVGWLFTTQPLAPKLERLNPIAGVKRLFNARNLVKTLLNTVKLAVVGAAAAMIVRSALPEIAALPALGLAAAMYKVALIAAQLVAWLLAIFLMLGIIDYSYQRWQHTRDLRMTRQEVKDERRNVEGDPDVKARRTRMAREIAMQRVRHAVPKADVIVTNPTHFSVALKYDSGKMGAPRVVAKGADELAFRIREIAIAHGVPMVERAPLARGLYWGVEVGQEIGPKFYEAVAEVLAFVYRLRGQAA
ncbi:MAG: flagellar biosynthesis protein FlhB [Phycisphaerales bacterium]